MRSQLLAGGAVMVVIASAVALFVGHSSISTARHRAERDAAFQATLGRGAIDRAIQDGTSAVAGLANSLPFGQLLHTAGKCHLDFAGDGVFRSGHFDIIRANGSLLCTSLTGAASARPGMQDPIPWLATTAATSGPMTGGVYRDALTGNKAIGITAPVSFAGKPAAGFVLASLDVASLATGLNDMYGGPRGFRFTVSDRDGVVLTGLPSGGGRIQASTPVSQLGWKLVASESATRALAPAHRTLWEEGLLAAMSLVLLLLLVLIVNQRIVRPLRRLAEAVGELGRPGATTVPDDGPRELRQFAQALNLAVRERAEQEDRLAHMALHDPLTGLANRALYVDRVNVALHAAAHHSHVAVLVVDFDRFKYVNSAVGYEGGEQILAEAARRMREVVGSDEALGRAGDGFLVCMVTSRPGDAATVAVRILDRLSVPFTVDGVELALTASVGGASGRPGADAASVLADAEIAMHNAKHSGGGQFRAVTDELRTTTNERLILETDMRGALRQGEMRLVFQPIVALADKQVIAAEALLRWQHPQRDLVAPATFIPLAEDSDLIRPIGRFVLNEACRQAVTWNSHGLGLRMAVNVSSRQLVDPHFTDYVLHELDEAGLSPGSLCLEITETALMADPLRVAAVLADLKQLGLWLSIDDFGTGYSALSYLHRFPFDELKIDRTFVQHVGVSDRHATLVATMIAMGQGLGLHVVAEGVETESQASTLVSMGCSAAQGYFFGPPMTADGLERRAPSRALDVDH